MELAMSDLFRAKWTDRIHGEWMRNLHQNRSVSMDSLARVRELMDAHVRDCLVTGYEPLIDAIIDEAFRIRRVPM